MPPPPSDTTFAEKFLRRLRKIDVAQVEVFLEQVLREKAFLEEVFDALTDGVVVTERGQKITYMNKAAGAFLGVAREDALGRPLEGVLRAKALLALAEEFHDAGEPIIGREVQVRTPARAQYAVTIVPLENLDDLTTHAVWVISDRTEARRLEDQRRQIDNLESLAALTAGVAHEVKNPLNSLNIHAQLIARAAGGLRAEDPENAGLERLERSTGVILEEIDRLKRVVDDFIRSVRPVRPNLRKASLNNLVLAIAELTGPQCSEKGIELTLDLDPELPQVLMDPEQIQQALLNIVKNGIEAIDKAHGLVTIRTRLRGDHVLLEVADNGCGIAEEDRLRIFEPYHSTKFDGTGLGLMVVYRIMRAHRGAVGLQSEEGIGTVFSLALPLDERPVKQLEAQVDPDLGSLEGKISPVR